MAKKRAKLLEPLVFPLFLALILVAGFIFRAEIANLFKNREAIREWIRNSGALGPFVFVGLQILQVVVFIIPGEIAQAAGGFIFGFWNGTALSLVGIAIGSLMNYGIGRLFGRPFMLAILSEASLARAESLLADRKTEAAYLLLFLVPGIPKDMLCYIAGMTKASAFAFLAASMIARLPGIVGSSLIGTATYSGRYRLVLGLLVGASLIFTAGIVWRKPLEAWLRNISRKKKES
jgi:uncharacterized membrane protein YdjX (TVP38/TMEM64 family)